MHSLAVRPLDQLVADLGADVNVRDCAVFSLNHPAPNVQGLSSQEATARLEARSSVKRVGIQHANWPFTPQAHGPNALPTDPPQPFWQVFLKQFGDILVSGTDRMKLRTIWLPIYRS